MLSSKYFLKSSLVIINSFITSFSTTSFITIYPYLWYFFNFDIILQYSTFNF
nr:MAG TPA: hypothetical protein [Caudoviricetes sp.]